MMKNALYFILKTLFVLNLFKYWPWLFGHVKKWLDSKDKVNFNIYDATWLASNYNTHISQSKSNQTRKYGQFIEYSKRSIVLQTSVRKMRQ